MTPYERSSEGNDVWALPDDVLNELDRHLQNTKPDLAVEAGSGRSTAVLARRCRRVVSFEHMPNIARQTMRPIATGNVDVRVARLKPYRTPAGTFRWYDTPTPDGIDFALIDGPPGRKVGRQAAGFAIIPNVKDDGVVWLDDADRDHEQQCLALWSKHLPIIVEPHPTFDRIAIIRKGT
jgi:predicted O-methyltransferase YrrM